MGRKLGGRNTGETEAQRELQSIGTNMALLLYDFGPGCAIGGNDRDRAIEMAHEWERGVERLKRAQAVGRENAARAGGPSPSPAPQEDELCACGHKRLVHYVRGGQCAICQCQRMTPAAGPNPPTPALRETEEAARSPLPTRTK
jgi:hypothetical protein